MFLITLRVITVVSVDHHVHALKVPIIVKSIAIVPVIVQIDSLVVVAKHNVIQNNVRAI